MLITLLFISRGQLAEENPGVERVKPKLKGNSKEKSSSGNFFSKIFSLDGSKFVWPKVLSRKQCEENYQSTETSNFSSSIAEKSYVKFVPYSESLYGEKIYVRRVHRRDNSTYGVSDRAESTYAGEANGDSTIYSGKSIESNNTDHLSGDAESSARVPGHAMITTSSSSASLISSNRVYRPPSLFSDSRELSEAECDRYSKLSEGHKSLNNELSILEGPEGVKEQLRKGIKKDVKLTECEAQELYSSLAKEHQAEAEAPESKAGEELTVILNRIYEHQNSPANNSNYHRNPPENKIENNNENPYTSESDKSAYSINV